MGAPGMAGGAIIGAAGALGGELVVQGLRHRGGTGGSSNDAPDPGGTISGFREQGVNITQRQIAAQQRAHTAGGSTAAYTGSTAVLNGHVDGHQPRDRQTANIGAVAPAPPPPAPAVIDTPATAGQTAAIPNTPARSGADVYSQLARASTRPRERSPSRADRRPLAVQRKEQENASMTVREAAMERRGTKIQGPAPAPLEVASSSNRPPPPPPPKGGIKVKAPEAFNIAKQPRAVAQTRPIAVAPRVSGVKRKAKSQLGPAARKKRPEPAAAPAPAPPPPPPPPPPPARNRKRVEPPPPPPPPVRNRKRVEPARRIKPAQEPVKKRAKVTAPKTPSPENKKSNWKQTKRIWTKAR